MRLLRQYQLDIIFLFFAFSIIIGVAFNSLTRFNADPHDYEWFIAGPIIILYFLYLWQIREKINLSDRRKMTGKSLLYWIVLGITLIMSYSSPISVKEYWSINVLFIIFTLLLADSYWDFKAMTVKSLGNKKPI